MHSEILTPAQTEILPFLAKYRAKYFMVGGTAIALHIGHRKSIDFDMFTIEKVNSLQIKKNVFGTNYTSSLIIALPDQIHFILNGVKLTFFEYPFPVVADIDFQNIFRIPDLLSLAAMKAFALGGRGKWKDYIDLYFIILNHYSIEEISAKASLLFKGMFNQLLFKEQLCYYKDINYTEAIEFMPGFEIDEKTIKEFLTDAALSEF